MSCAHLKKLFDMCLQEDIKIGGTDLVRIVCNQCGAEEVCPTMLMEQYEELRAERPDAEGQENDEENDQ